MNSNGDKSGRLGEVKAPHFVAGVPVYGHLTDYQTRCVHYHSPLDIIAIKFRCCDRYYPCNSCHAENSDHAAQQWPEEERDVKAILCGACGHELTINEYLQSNNQCTSCKAAFNPNCSLHYSHYFHM
ncbi:MAG: CHY zinc finger protein [Bacteroidota bacterium]